MESLCQLPSTLLSLLLPLLILSFASGASSVSFTIANNCSHPIWPGLLSSAGSSPLPTTGFALQEGASTALAFPAGWSGRVWARTLCATDVAGKFICATGDCASGTVECSGAGAIPPATLAEFTLNGADGQDFYDVSLVDGYNLPMLVVPVGGVAGNCSTTGCATELNGGCPAKLKVSAANRSVACKSACVAFGDQRSCCSGDFATPDTCKPTSYSEYFKHACPRAYSYAYDDGTSTFTCVSANYVITFCPSSTTSSGPRSEGGGPATTVMLTDSDDAPAATSGGCGSLVTALVAGTISLIAASFTATFVIVTPSFIDFF